MSSLVNKIEEKIADNGTDGVNNYLAYRCNLNETQREYGGYLLRKQHHFMN